MDGNLVFGRSVGRSVYWIAWLNVFFYDQMMQKAAQMVALWSSFFRSTLFEQILTVICIISRTGSTGRHCVQPMNNNKENSQRIHDQTKRERVTTSHDLGCARSLILSLSFLVCSLIVCGVWFQYDLLSQQQQQPPHPKPNQNKMKIFLLKIYLCSFQTCKNLRSQRTVRPSNSFHWNEWKGGTFKTIVACKSFLRYFQFAIFAHSVQTENYNEIRYLSRSIAQITAINSKQERCSTDKKK